MIERCYRHTSKFYKDYGGRGIKVCDEWRNSFIAFISDMGLRPDNNLTLERMDNNDGYHPTNCKWATMKEQMRNRRNNTKYMWNGELRVLADLVETYGHTSRLVCWRLDNGWSLERALLTPVGAWGGSNYRKTHCPHGHLYDEKNTRIRKSGRACRKCDSRHSTERRRRRAAERVAFSGGMNP